MTYSSSLAVGRQRYAARSQRKPQSLGNRVWGRNQNTTNFRTGERRIGPVSNTLILLVLACLLGLLYLTQVTKTNAYSYRLNDLREQQTALESEHDQLEIDSARLQALERVKNSQVAKNFVSVAPSATISN